MVAALLVLTVLTIGVGPGVPTSAADEGPPCGDLPPNHPCWGIPLPEDPPPDEPPPDDDQPDEPPSTEPPPPQDCTNPGYGWAVDGDQSAEAWSEAGEDQADWPDGSLVYERTCARNLEEADDEDWGPFPTNCGDMLPDGVWLICTQTRVFAPGDEPDPPATPADVAGWGWLCIEGWFDTPDVDLWPRPDVPAVVGVPTFVAMGGDWPPFEEVTGDQAACPPGVNVEVERSDDDVEITVSAAGLTVRLVGEARFLYDTGEPSDDGTTVVDCGGPGRPFQRDGDPAEVQADAPGACTHTYTSRTLPGEPWPASVEFSWDIEARMGGVQVATFGPLTSGTTFDRQVDEVQAVVSDVGRDGGDG